MRAKIDESSQEVRDELESSTVIGVAAAPTGSTPTRASNHQGRRNRHAKGTRGGNR